MVEWQPIETAPRDGSEIRAVAQIDCGVVIHPYKARFVGGNWCAQFVRGWLPVDPQPTHWMLAPEPPQTGGRNERDEI